MNVYSPYHKSAWDAKPEHVVQLSVPGKSVTVSVASETSDHPLQEADYFPGQCAGMVKVDQFFFFLFFL